MPPIAARLRGAYIPPAKGSKRGSKRSKRKSGRK